MTATSGRLLAAARAAAGAARLAGRASWPSGSASPARTIRRDVERLRELGYPVDALSGPAGGYRLRAGTAMPPLLLDDEEAVAIAVGLRGAASGAARSPASRRRRCARS